jgi:hypothetical protein
MALIFSIITIIGLYFIARILYQQNREILAQLEEKKGQPKYIRSPNKLETVNPDLVQFDENNPMAIPKNVKFEIEGGNVNSPYELN